MPGDFVQEIVLRIRADGTAEVAKLADSLKDLGKGAGDAGSGAAGASGGVSQLGDELGKMAEQAIKAALEMAAFAEMLRVVKEAVSFSDSIRDIQNSLNILSASVESGKAVFEKFDKAADATRYTTLQLATVFRDALPSALRRGVSDEELAHITVQMAKIGPILAGGMEAGMQGMEQVMVGRIRKTSQVANLLLKGTGFQIEDLLKGGNDVVVIEAMLKNLDKLAAQTDIVGQSFESTGKKIKDSLFESFSLGFNEANGGSQKLYASMLEAFNDPKIVDGIKGIGTAVSTLIPLFAQLTASLLMLVSTFWSSLGEEIGSRGVGGTLADLGKSAAMMVTGKYDTIGDSNAAGLNTHLNSVRAAQARMQSKSDAMTSDLAESDTFAPATKTKMKSLSTAGTVAVDDVDKWTEAIKKLGLEEDKTFTDYEAHLKLLNADPITQGVAKLAADEAIKINALKEDELKIQGDLSLTDSERNAKMGEFYDLLLKTRADYKQMKADFTDNSLAEQFKKAVEASEKLDQQIGNNIRSIEKAAKAEQVSLLLDPSAVGDPQKMAANAKLAADLQINTEREIEAMRGVTDEKQISQIKETYGEVTDVLKKSATAWADVVKTAIEQPIAGFLQNIATSGIGGALASEFTKAIGSGTTELSKIFGKIFSEGFGERPDISQFTDSGGKVDTAGFAEATATADANNARIGKTISGVFAVAGAAMHAADVISGKVHESAVATIVSFTAAGAAVGNWIGAIVGFVVGVVVAAFAPPVGKDYQYANFGIKNGQAYVSNANKNLSQGDITQMLHNLQDQLDGFVTSYVKILLKFPLQVIEGLSLGAKSLTVTPGILDNFGSPTGDPYAIGNAASAHFMDHFTAWVTNELPAKIAAAFEGQVGTAFGAMGMTTGKFSMLWKSLQGMDPKAALQVLSDMADALVGWNRVQSIMTNIGSFSLSGGAISSAGTQTGLSDFEQSVADAHDGLIKLGIAVETLWNGGQLAQSASAAALLAQGMNTLADSLVAYLNKLQAGSKALSQSLSDLGFSATVANAGLTPGAAGKNAQSTLYEQRYNQDLYQLRNAATLHLSADDITRLTNDAANMLSAMLALDPAKRFAWFMTQLDVLDAAQKAATLALGAQARSAVEALLAQLQPVVNFFNGLPAVVDPALKTLDTSALSAATAVDRFAARLNAVTTSSKSTSSASVDTSSSAPQEVVVSIEVSDPTGYVRSVRSRRVATRG
jgi:hypothetical protein